MSRLCRHLLPAGQRHQVRPLSSANTSRRLPGVGDERYPEANAAVGDSAAAMRIYDPFIYKADICLRVQGDELSAWD